MVPVEGGTLVLGKHYPNELCSSKNINISGFNIGKYEITQADWLEIMQNYPAFKNACPLCPVENVSWKDIQEFVQKASKAHGKKYRLPFEVEWEYAARGGQLSQDFLYAGSNKPDAVAWYNTIREHTHEVGMKSPNELGTYDMSGNVREWCQDVFPAYLQCENRTSNKKFLRGGSWVNPSDKINVTDRTSKKMGHKDEQSGFRLVADR